MINSLQKVDIEGTYINIINTIYDKPTSSLILNVEKLKAFPLQSGTRQGCPHSPLLLNTLLEVFARTNREKDIKGMQIGKEDKKLSLYADDMIIYAENPKDATRKLLELINEFGNVTGYNMSTQTSITFLYTNNKRTEREIKETITFIVTSKRIKYLGINLPRETKDLYAENYKTLMKGIKDDK